METTTIVNIVVFSLNIIISLTIKDFYATVGWISAVSYAILYGLK